MRWPACSGWSATCILRGYVAPRCRSRDYRSFRPKQAFPGYRCHDGDSAFTILTGTAFEKTRQKPSTVVLLLRGIAQGETTARLSRELSLSYKQTLTLRHRLQDHANETAPLGPDAWHALRG